MKIWWGRGLRLLSLCLYNNTFKLKIIKSYEFLYRRFYTDVPYQFLMPLLFIDGATYTTGGLYTTALSLCARILNLIFIKLIFSFCYPLIKIKLDVKKCFNDL